MNKTLKTFATAILVAGATATAAQAETVYQTLSVQLTLVQQDTAVTNTHKGAGLGTITDTDKGGYTINTAQLIKLLAPSVGITTIKNASLVKATTVVPGVNLTDFSNVVFITNYTYQTNGSTNVGTEITITNPPPPPTNYTLVSTNYATNVVAFETNAIEAGTNVQFFILNDGKYYPLTMSNNTSGGTISAGDDAWYFFSGITNYNLAQNLTNFGIFVGNITTNLKITGSFITGDSISLSLNPNSGADGTAANPTINVSGSGKPTATTTEIGKGKDALPFSTWNATFTVAGSATEGGVVTNVVDQHQSFYVYASNGVPYPFNGPYNTDFNTYGTNPPHTISGYTNVGTNIYTDVNVKSPTNHWSVSGTVHQTFQKASTTP